MIDMKKDMQQADNLILAKKIADAIKGSPLTAKDVADKCGVTPQAVSGWKKTGRIAKGMLGRFAEVVEVPLSHFIVASDVIRDSPVSLTLVSQLLQDDIVGPDEIIELISGYSQAAKKDRDTIMNLVKTAAARAVRQGERTKDK